MKKTIEAKDGTKITYRLPNVIELFELQHNSEWGKEGNSGYGMIAKILTHAEPFIVSVKGSKKTWAACLEDRSMADELSTLALSLIKDEVGEEEKKS